MICTYRGAPLACRLQIRQGDSVYHGFALLTGFGVADGPRIAPTHTPSLF